MPREKTRRALQLCPLLVLGLVGCHATHSPWQLAATGLDFPEGPAWDGRALYLSNCYGGWIARLDLAGVDTFVVLPEARRPNGLAFGPDGELYACDFAGKAVVRFGEGGTLQVVSRGPEGEPFHRPNDLAFDSAGRLYVTDPKSYDPKLGDGRVIVVDLRTGAARTVVEALAFPNGLAFSPKDGKLYVSESARQRVLRFKLGADGRPFDQEVFVELPGGDPDGLAFDAHGNLYVAHFGAGQVVVVHPKGDVRARLAVPGRKPTNLEFAGKGLRRLFVTEAETNSLYSCAVSVPGSPLPWIRATGAR